MPYWSDAIGQIPFAVNYSKDLKSENKKMSNYTATILTNRKGREYGEGKLFGGKTDNSNTYDNYFIYRGAANGVEGRDITKPVTKEEAKNMVYSLKSITLLSEIIDKK